MKKKLITLVLLAVSVVLVIGSRYVMTRSPKVTTPIVVMGLDGLEWDIILPMLRNERLPNFAKLMERGYYGTLETIFPCSSPIIWTSIATGKVREKHGINNFARRLPGNRTTLFNNTHRKTKAIWNILSDYGMSVTTIGWWMTYPVESINGVMVAQTNTMNQLDTRAGKHVWKGTLLKGVRGQVYPPDRQDEMITILEEVEMELPDLMKQIFGEFHFPFSLLEQRLWDNCTWAFRADETYRRIALKLAQEDFQPDLLLLYFGGPDVVSHRFWRYMQPNIYRHKPSTEQISNFGTVIEDYYAYADRALGQLLKAYGSEVTFIVISDHGFHAANLNGHFDPDDPPSNINSGDHYNAPPALFLAAGPNIRTLPMDKPLKSLTRQDLEKICTVFDITPTILAMMRIPIGRDMDGHVVTRIFHDEFQINLQPRTIATHDTAEFFAYRGKKSLPHPNEKERIRQLHSLGYIGGGEEED